MNTLADSAQLRSFLGDLGKGVEFHEAAERSNLSKKAVSTIEATIQFALAANDGDLDDYIYLLEFFNLYATDFYGFYAEPSTVSILATQGFAAERGNRYSMKEVFFAITVGFTDLEIRQLATMFLRFADAKIQKTQNADGIFRLEFPERSSDFDIEKIKKVARQERLIGLKKREVLSSEVSNDPIWYLLLELFHLNDLGYCASMNTLSSISGVSEETTGLFLKILEKRGLIKGYRDECAFEKPTISLTEQGVSAVCAILNGVCADITDHV